MEDREVDTPLCNCVPRFSLLKMVIIGLLAGSCNSVSETNVQVLKLVYSHGYLPY
jgi:hypothetical protein